MIVCTILFRYRISSSSYNETYQNGSKRLLVVYSACWSYRKVFINFLKLVVDKELQRDSILLKQNKYYLKGLIMFTINYRGLYIQGYTDKQEFYISIYPNIKYNTLRAAKMGVTKLLRKIKGYSVPLKDLHY